ncbi:MAG: hypothetical protein ACL93V_16695 [Candidatus Electrothrix sp. YB6]
MAKTNYLDSDLSNAKYKYDLVVGTTADAINASMKMWLYKNAPDAKEVWYQQEDVGGPITPMTPIEGVDPFQYQTDEEIPDSLTDSAFVFAIKAGFGLPKGVTPLDVPDVIELTSQRQQVNYNMFFNTFSIVTLEWGRRGRYAWKNYTQPNGEPYIFNYKVDMNMNAADPTSKFSDLPEKTQKLLLNYNANSMYSVQQLFLDLNNAGLQSVPTISGIPSNSPVIRTLEEDFINTYWKDQAENKHFVLGYAVHNNNRTTAASIQPTSLNFQVVPYHDKDGNATNETNLYTLNYLSMTEGRPLTVGAAFPWNWVDKSKVAEFHGAMAVRRDVFGQFLSEKISPYLCHVCIEPYSYIDIYSAGLKSKTKWRLSHATDQQFSSTSSGSKILEFNYSNNSRSSDKSGWISGHFNMDSTASGSITVSGNEITMKIDSKVTMDLDNGDIFGVGEVSGRCGSYSSTTIWEVTVDGQGDVNVLPKSGYPQITFQGSNYDMGAFAKIDGTADVGESLDKIYKKMSDAMENFNTLVRDYLNSSGGKWIFPGGQTFIFKDAAFSDDQDFVTHISYADPS